MRQKTMTALLLATMSTCLNGCAPLDQVLQILARALMTPPAQAVQQNARPVAQVGTQNVPAPSRAASSTRPEPAGRLGAGSSLPRQDRSSANISDGSAN